MTDRSLNLARRSQAWPGWERPSAAGRGEARQRAKVRESEIEEQMRRLEAAVETLRTLEYGQEVLK
jgi:hypothetical protein